MRQLTWTGGTEVRWDDVPDAKLEGDGEALVRPLAVATCDLDMAVVNDAAIFPPPIALGHETIAEVVDVGDAVEGVEPGALVAVPCQISCGECAACREGRTGNCETVPGAFAMYGLGAASGDWGGALADLLRVPYADAMLVPLRDGLDPAAVASAGDNIVDAWRTVAPQLEQRPGADVLIVGGGATGSIGLYACGIASALGAGRVDYTDADPDRRERARRLGAEPHEPDYDQRLGSYPITVDASADHAGLRYALRSAAPDGVCTSIGVYFEPDVPIPMLEIYTKGITFHTSRPHCRAHMPAALELIANGGFDPAVVTAQTVAWDDAAEALTGLRSKTVVIR
jgi:threonine dehydrogenase-like Zn-dependent dehydrogenase